MEVPSDFQGEISEILIKEGDSVHEGMEFAKIKAETEVKEAEVKEEKGKEIVKLNYKSSLNQKSFDELLENSINKDRAFQFTTEGIHKDDIELLIHGKTVKKFGSQGQKKTYLISLKI